MRISDWSSDVCSSDLFGGRLEREQDRGVAGMMGPGGRKDVKPRPVPRRLSLARKIGAKRVARGGDFRPRPPDRAGPLHPPVPLPLAPAPPLFPLPPLPFRFCTLLISLLYSPPLFLFFFFIYFFFSFFFSF